MKNIGVIGLGTMGNRIAGHILRSGFPLIVYDIRQGPVDALVIKGAIGAKSPREVAEKSDIILLMVLNYQQCVSCLTGQEGILAGLKVGGIIVVLTTMSIDEIEDIEALIITKNEAKMLDAPVSGGLKGAENGTLTIMAAGSDEIYTSCLPILRCFGTNPVQVGKKIGQGQAMKAINQLMVAVNMIGTAEAFTLGVKCGLNPEIIYQTLSKCSGTSYIFEDRGPRIIARNFETRSTLSIQVKDTEISCRTANAVRSPAFIANICLELFKIAESKYTQTNDSMEVIRLYEDLGNVDTSKAYQSGSLE